MLNVLAQDLPEVAFAGDQQPVQGLATSGSDPAFTDGVRSGRPVGRGHHPDTLRTKDLVEADHELAVAIVDQELRPQIGLAELPTQVACLLGDPGRGRLLGAAGQEDPTRGQLDEEHHVQLLQPKAVDAEEVAGQDGTCLSPQESLPAQSRPPRRRRHSVAAQDTSDRGRRDLIAELAQLALDAAKAPAWVLAGQTQDQLLALGGQWRTTETATRATPKGIPLATDQLTVPTKDGLRADQEGRPGRSRQPAAERGQQQAIARLPARATGLALEDAKLMADKEYLGLEAGLRAAADEEEIEEQAEQTVEQGQ